MHIFHDAISLKSSKKKLAYNKTADFDRFRNEHILNIVVRIIRFIFGAKPKALLNVFSRGKG